MNQKNDINIEMQEVGAYPTKNEMNQKQVPLLEGKDRESQATNSSEESTME